MLTRHTESAARTPAFIPRPGDEVLARCSPVAPFTRAVVLAVSPSKDPRRVRVFFV